MTPDAFISRLKGVKAKGKNKWMACCPAHDDHDPSLSVAVAPDGKILLRCWTGCSAADVVAAMGLHLGDLFPNERDYAPPMAFAQKERRQIADRQSQIDRERMVIALAHSDRLAGKRQSEKDKARELQAVRALIVAGVEWEPDVVHAAVWSETK